MGKKIIGNHKNYMLVSDISEYLKQIDNKINNSDVIICPSNIYIPYFLKKGFSVGIQNVFIRNDVAVTGEISNKQAVTMSIDYVIIGHSERRTYFDESEVDINKKIVDALKYGMKVILCIGETLEERNLLKTTRVLKKQIREDLKNIEDFSNIIIAYEPVWAIGTNKVPSNDDIKKASMYIKETINNLYNVDNIEVLYGGSVNSKNIKEINKIQEIDGVLVGKASTDAKEFLKIIEVVSD